jgi:hypothetical protein
MALVEIETSTSLGPPPPFLANGRIAVKDAAALFCVRPDYPAIAKLP